MKNPIKLALTLAYITVFYNILEGLFSVLLGINDETIALAGFGIDSFVEVFSGIGILHMLIRFKQTSEENIGRFEKTALYITSISFYILTLSLIITAVLNLFLFKKQPESTLAGIIISLISILTMWLLVYYKNKVALELNSKAIKADAACTKTCMNLSFVLLASSFLYQIWNIPYVDSLAGIIIAYFSFKEGKEAWSNAKTSSIKCSCSCH